ncbi:MAG: hypothetical protein AABY15_06865 [Nanoarchaeota archaeon]
MDDKPIIIGHGIDSLSMSVARLLASKGLSAHDVVIVDLAKHKSVEDIQKTIQEGTGKMIVIEDVEKMLKEFEPKEVFPIHARPEFKEIKITQADVEKYHPFSKFMNNKRKKW